MNLNFIPSWFLLKSLNQNQRYAYEIGEKEIEKETEKAILVKVISEFGKFNFWCPKSIIK